MTTDVGRFEAFCAEVGLQLEDFQRVIVAEAFTDRRELLVSMPRGNGKSTLCAALGLFELLRDASAAIVVAAAARDQAQILFDQARKMALRSDFIRSRVTVTRRELRTSTDGVLRVVSADADKQLGLILSRVFIDELCAHRTDELYIALRTAMLKIPRSKLVTISTAGVTGQTPLEALRDRCLAQPSVHRDGVFTRCEGPNIAMLEWALAAEAPLEQAIDANPASWVTAGGLAEQREAVHETAYRRFHANQWVAAGEDAFLALEAWDACAVNGLRMPLTGTWALGMDGSRTFDCTAVAQACKAPDGAVELHCRVFGARPDAPAHEHHRGKIDMGAVEDYVIDLFGRHTISEVAYDPRYLERSAELLDARLPQAAIFAVEPSSKHMREALQTLYRLVSERRLRHSGDPVLREHVAGAVVDRRSEGDEIRRVRKADPRRSIDGLVASALAVWRAEHPAPPVEAWATDWLRDDSPQPARQSMTGHPLGQDPNSYQ